MATKVLALYNESTMDTNIKFYEKGHKYEVLDDLNTKYISVTTWIHSHFPKFNADLIIETMMKSKGWGPEHKYWGQTPDQIKKSWNQGAVAGTNLHYEIECFMNNSLLEKGYTHLDLKNISNKKNTSSDWEYFLQFISDFPNLKPYRTEWTVYDKDLKISGSIDMVYENEDGTLSIYDWKRCKEINKNSNWNKYALTDCISHLPDTNFWHYALQLNTYKIILERQYNRQVSDLFLVQIHPENTSQSYELISVPILSQEMDDLIEKRKRDITKQT